MAYPTREVAIGVKRKRAPSGARRPADSANPCVADDNEGEDQFAPTHKHALASTQVAARPPPVIPRPVPRAAAAPQYLSQRPPPPTATPTSSNSPVNPFSAHVFVSAQSSLPSNAAAKAAASSQMKSSFAPAQRNITQLGSAAHPLPRANAAPKPPIPTPLKPAAPAGGSMWGSFASIVSAAGATAPVSVDADDDDLLIARPDDGLEVFQEETM